MGGNNNDDFDDSDIVFVPDGGTLPDIRIKLIFHVFAVHAVFCMSVMMLSGAIVFFNVYESHVTADNVLVLLILSITLIILYAGLALTRRMELEPRLVMATGGVFCLVLGIFAGVFSLVVNNSALIHFFVLCFGQAIAVVAYCWYSPRLLNLYVAVVLMCISTLMYWTFSIYGFIIESDWLGGLIILALATMSVTYNVLYIQRTKGQYDASWDQGLLAVLDYYCYDAVRLIRYLIN